MCFQTLKQKRNRVMICQNVKKINRIVEDHNFVANITTGDGGTSKIKVNIPIDKVGPDVWFKKKKVTMRRGEFSLYACCVHRRNFCVVKNLHKTAVTIKAITKR